MKNRRPSVDVILCSYNQEMYIGQAVESVLAQNVDAEVRLIVADDFSTDNTMQIIRSHGRDSSFPFDYLDSRENIGMRANYKRAFAECSSDYVAILEGDDWWCETNHLAQHLSFLEEHPRYSMSYNLIELYLQDQGISRKQKWLYEDVDYLTIKLKHLLSWGNQIGNLSSCVFRTKYLQELPEDFFQLDFADWELSIMMAQKGPIANLRDVTSSYRINSKGQWSAISEEKKQQSIEQTLLSIQKFLPKHSRKYVKIYQKHIKDGTEPQFPMPMRYRVKSFIRHMIYPWRYK